MIKNKFYYYFITLILVFIGIFFGTVLQKEFRILDSEQESSLSIISGENSIPEEFHGKLKIFILAGQSNITGITNVENELPRIYTFGSDNYWKTAIEYYGNSSEHVENVLIDIYVGYGPANSFAETLLEHNPELVIGFVPCARGGTGIIKWQKSSKSKSLYRSCLEKAREASKMGEISGILFYQGETDTLDPEMYSGREPLPEDWADLFVTFVSNFRNDLGLPDLPVIYAQLSNNDNPEKYINWEIVKAQQLEVSLLNGIMITTDDLNLIDEVHLSPESQSKLGTRFAEAYLTFIESP